MKTRLILLIIAITRLIMCKMFVLLYITLNCLILYTSGNNISFSGFTEGRGYTYYTNGNNLVTELTCTAHGVINSTAHNIRSSWFYNQDTDTGSNVLRFENVATEVKWKESREYFCRAVYLIYAEEYQEDSDTITVYIECELINDNFPLDLTQPPRKKS